MNTKHKDAVIPPVAVAPRDAAPRDGNPPPIKLLYTTGETTQIFSFADRCTMYDWDKQILGIKHRVDWINEQWYPHPRRSLYRVWLQEVYDFCGVFGNDYVPDDVRRSVNSVERAEGVAVTRW